MYILRDIISDILLVRILVERDSIFCVRMGGGLGRRDGLKPIVFKRTVGFFYFIAKQKLTASGKGYMIGWLRQFH
jgi:hypothetical protein